LLAFESKLLPLHDTNHVQFALFYLISLRADLCHNFLSWLWAKFLNPSVPHVIRMTTACYLASLIARAKFVSVGVAKSYLSAWVEWAHKYNQNLDCVSDYNVDDLFLHGNYYAICQAIIYVLAFRHREFFTGDKELSFLQRLSLERIVTSSLNPLKYCSETVVSNFAFLTRNSRLIYCDTVIERNKRHRIYSLFGRSVSNPLESFYPFDPYLLKRSARFIAPIYREYRGVPDDNFDLMETGHCVESECQSVKVVSNSFKDFNMYSISPGFVNHS